MSWWCWCIAAVVVVLAALIGGGSLFASMSLMARESEAIASTAMVAEVLETPQDEWHIYRYASVVFRLPVLSTPETTSSLLARVRAILQTGPVQFSAAAAFRNVTKLTRMYGEPVTDLYKDVPMHDRRLFALAEHELWMFPAFKLGDVVRVRTSDSRQIRVKTVSVAPRVFELDGFLADDECEHMIARAKREQLVDSTVGAEVKLGSKSQQRTSQQAWVGPGQNNDDEVFAARAPARQRCRQAAPRARRGHSDRLLQTWHSLLQSSRLFGALRGQSVLRRGRQSTAHRAVLSERRERGR
jgi:hypothetical protein